MPTATAIYNRIKDFRGGVVENWNPIEDELFMALNQVFSAWLTPGGPNRQGVVNANRATIKQATLKTKLETLEKALAKNNVETAFCNKGKKLGSDQLPAQTPSYSISNLGEFLGAIHAIGLDAKAQTQPYVLHFPNGGGSGVPIEVFLSQWDHYAFPLEINGQQPNLTEYHHDYGTILPPLAKPFTTFKAEKFFKKGQFPDTSLDTITALAATYFAESNRNQMQLFTTIIEQQLNEMTTPKSFNSQPKRFPMSGGSWGHKWCWGAGANGNGINMKADGASTETGRQQKRWGLGIIISDTVTVSDPGKEPVKEPVLDDRDWINYIQYLIGKAAEGVDPNPVSSEEVKLKVFEQLDKFAAPGGTS